MLFQETQEEAVAWVLGEAEPGPGAIGATWVQAEGGEGIDLCLLLQLIVREIDKGKDD